MAFEELYREIQEQEKKGTKPHKAAPQKVAPVQEAPKDTILSQALGTAPTPKPEQQTMLGAIINAPRVIAEGVSINPGRIIGKAAANTFIPNISSAIKEERYKGIPAGAAVDIGQFLFSPLKALKGAKQIAKIQKLNDRFKLLKLINNATKPITKSTDQLKNLKRNAISEGITGVVDNLAFEAASDALDNRSHGIGEYALSAGLGGAIGAPTGVLQAFKQKKARRDYAGWLTPLNHSGEVKQNIRNAQNNTSSDLETFSQLVNDGHPFNTTEELRDKAMESKKLTNEKLDEYLNSQEANKGLEDATIVDFIQKMQDKLEKDYSGNMGEYEKKSILKNFHDDILDYLLSNSERAKDFFGNSMVALAKNPKLRLNKDDKLALLMMNYELSPNEIQMLRKSFQDRTTLVIPSKSGYVRAGEDNRNFENYYELFKNEIDTRPEMETLSKLNKEWSKHKNHEEVLSRVNSKQKLGEGGKNVEENYFPYLDLNPEINPTVFGKNRGLQVRNAVGGTVEKVRRVEQMPEEEKAELETTIRGLVEDGQKMGLQGVELQNFVKSALTQTAPRGKVVAVSNQSKYDR